MVVEVYRNLNKSKKRMVYSIRCVKTKRVILHMESLSLKDCIFFVSQAGRKRVLKDKSRNVHAWIRGTLIDQVRCKSKVRYNPYVKPNFFYSCNGKMISESKYVTLNQNGLFVRVK